LRLAAGLLLVLLPALAAALLRQPAEALHGLLLAPSLAHPLGTDALGQDVLHLTLAGLRRSLGAAAVGVGAAAPVALGLGLAAGWRGGAAAEALRAVLAVFLALPSLIVALLLVLAMPQAPVAAVALAWGPRLAATASAEAARLRAAPFVDALLGQGLRPARLLLHLLANAAPALAAALLAGLRETMLVLAALGFLGLGLRDLGYHLAAAPAEAWWCVLAPALALLLPCLGLGLLAGQARGLAR
jgi:peptide/nickel transport system permease protein